MFLKVLDEPPTRSQRSVILKAYSAAEVGLFADSFLNRMKGISLCS